MADSKSNYSNTASAKTSEASSNPKIQAAYVRAKEEERRFNSNWSKNKVNLNDLVEKFAPIHATKLEGSRKYNIIGKNYIIKVDLFSGSARVFDRTIKRYVKLDGTKGTLDQTHFKIKKREEM